MFPRSSGRFPPMSEGTQLHTHSLPFRSTLAAATKPRNQPSSVSSALGCQSSVTRRWGGRAATIIMRQAKRERASREKLRKQTSSGHECRFICDREREERGTLALWFWLWKRDQRKERIASALCGSTVEPQAERRDLKTMANFKNMHRVFEWNED